MRLRLVLGALLFFGASAHAKSPPSHSVAPHASSSSSPPPPRAEPRPATPLPMLPRMALVDVEAAPDHVVLIEDIRLPRGDWRSGGLDLYVAFGAPGLPMAVDARLGTIAHGADAAPKDFGEPLGVEQAVRWSPGWRLLLGRPQMAGFVLHLKEADLERVYAHGDMADLRVRRLLPAPAVDPTGAREIVVRLGISGELPLTLGRIQVVSLETKPWIARAEASLCGPDADAPSLAVTLLPGPAPAPASGWTAPPPSPTNGGPIAPAMAVRHASDDLCVRWWAPP